MCTAVTYRTKDAYFGRNLDLEYSYGEEVTVTPRNFCLSFRDQAPLRRHYAIMGMAHIADGYPLYYDAFNEKGLAVAALNFVHSARYRVPEPGKRNVAHFELIPWILGQCATVEEAKPLLEDAAITDQKFRPDFPVARLHWLIADRDCAITVEAVEEGLRIHENPVGVLTNEPPFAEQLFQLNNYLQLSPDIPENRFSSRLNLHPYSRGMGALGLPGDLSSQSRFARAAFVKLNSRSGESEAESVSQFFHILGSVEHPRGCCRLENGEYEITVYSSCCNLNKGIYYYTTYDNRQIIGVQLREEYLEGDALVRYPLIYGQRFLIQNGENSGE